MMTYVCETCAENVTGDLQEESADEIRYSFDCDGDRGCGCQFEVTFRAEDAVVVVAAGG